MRCVIRGASIVAVGILAALAVAGCDKDSTSTGSTTASPNRPLVAQSQYGDAGGGMPNPMPGLPLGEAGVYPGPGPTTNPGSPVNPGSPSNPGSPNYPGNPSNPGAPGNPGNPNNPGSPGSPGTPGSPGGPPLGH